MYKYKLYGAILGDLAGQPYEFPIMKGPYINVDVHNPKSTFTDDTLLTLASANFLLGNHNTIEEAYKDMGNRYQGDYYGKGFKSWLNTPLGTINNSYGNGCLMRVAPFMYVPDSLPLIIDSVFCSHKNTISVESVIKLYNRYKNGYVDFKNLPIFIQKFKKFEVRADITVDFCLNLCAQTYGTHKCIVKAIQCGGDTDTNASICGEISNYYMKDISEADVNYVNSKLDSYLLNILTEFNERF